MASAAFHCELAWLGGEAPARDVVVATDDGVISAVTVGSPAGDAVRLSGIVLPGLANAHSHAFHRALRSRTQAGTGTFWTWRDDMYRLAGTLDPDSYQRLARATFAEMVLAGVTCVGEFHYLHHAPGGTSYADPNAMGAAVVGFDQHIARRRLPAQPRQLAVEGGGRHRPVSFRRARRRR